VVREVVHKATTRHSRVVDDYPKLPFVSPYDYTKYRITDV